MGNLKNYAALRYLGVILVGVFSVLLGFRNLLFVDPEQYLWADDFDPRFLRWTAEWGYQALALNHSWSLFWNAPIFYPHEGTLAFSDSLLTLQLFYSPLRLLGLGPHTALYMSLGSIAVFGFALTVFLLDKLEEFSTMEALLIGFASHFSLVMWTFLPHYQLFGFHFAPPILLSLYLFFIRLELHWLVLAQILFVLGSCLSVYLAPSIVLMSTVIAVVTLPWSLAGVSWRRLAQVGLVSALISLVLGSTLYFGHMRIYSRMVDRTTEQTLEEIATYSANPSSLVTGRSIQSFWWKPYGGGYAKSGDWERAYFPGFLLLLGGTLGTAGLLLPSKNFGKQTRYFCFTCFCVGLAALVLSWGPFLDGHKTPFFYLTQVLPILKNTRAMGRFGMFLGLPLGVFLVMGLRFLTNSNNSSRRAKVIGLFALLTLAIESLPTGQIIPYSEPLKDRHQYFGHFIEPKEPVVELPCHAENHINTIRRILEQMSGTLYHKGWSMVGYSGRSTPETQTLIHTDQQLAAGAITWSDMLKYLRQMRIAAILIHKDQYPPHIAQSITADVAGSAHYELITDPSNTYVVLKALE